jgi:16S rRNA (cytidine1402-2'-O)-methyltransferase
VVAQVLAAGLRVESIPGACALVVGLTASGLPTESFHFAGFLPHKSGQRANRLAALARLPGTLVLYESPFRVERLLEELQVAMPERRVVLARELTKKFEEWLRGTPAELAAQLKLRPRKGEFVVLVEGGSGKAESAAEEAEL